MKREEANEGISGVPNSSSVPFYLLCQCLPGTSNSPSLLPLYFMCWFTFRAEPNLSKPRVLYSTSSSWLITEAQSFRWDLCFPLFFLYSCFTPIWSRGCSLKFSATERNLHVMFRTNLVEMLEQHLCTHKNAHREKDKWWSLQLWTFTFSSYVSFKTTRSVFVCGWYDLAHSFSLVSPCSTYTSIVCKDTLARATPSRSLEFSVCVCPFKSSLLCVYNMALNIDSLSVSWPII